MKASNDDRTERKGRAKHKPTGTSFSRAIEGKAISNDYANTSAEELQSKINVTIKKNKGK